LERPRKVVVTRNNEILEKDVVVEPLPKHEPKMATEK